MSSLSMREIARTLGVGVMSLYNHVANKDDVLSGITDLVASEFALPSGPDWKLALRNSAISAHDALLRHLWACTTMSSGMTTLGPERLAFYDALVGTLRKADSPPGWPGKASSRSTATSSGSPSRRLSFRRILAIAQT